MTSLAGAAVQRKTQAPVCTTQPATDPSRTMRAVQWWGTRDVRLGDMPRPLLTDPGDAIVRITTASICGSDLHLYNGKLPGMKAGDILGHEMMGIVEEVGPDVRGLQAGDRVVVCSNVSCGECYYCRQGLNIYCGFTNPGPEQDLLFGHHNAGLFGYSHLCGGYPGGQAEYLRVPLADTACLKVPPELPDEKVVFLGDILSTAWHGCELGEVAKGESVAIWGAGPVGILVAHCCAARGAGRILLIDPKQYRLDHVHAGSHIPGLETINCSEHSVPAKLRELFGGDPAGPGGPVVCIEAVGMHYARSVLHEVERALSLETDSAEVLNEMIESVRKAGRIAMIGDWAGLFNHVKLGGLMQKGLTLRSSMCPMQARWPGLYLIKLLHLIQEGELDPSIVVTHIVPLEQAPRHYRLFSDQDETEQVVKVLL